MNFVFETMNFVFETMNFVFETMNFVFETMNCVSKVMSFALGACWIVERRDETEIIVGNLIDR